MSKIMILEDDPASQLLMKEILRNRDYEIVIFDDGLPALQAIDQEMPDLIIVDVMLPTINGYQFCERLHRNPKFSNTPIIILTALNEDQHRIRAMEAGAMDFLSKPFKRVELLTKIETLISRQKSTADLLSLDTFAGFCTSLMKLRLPEMTKTSIRVKQYAERISAAYGLPRSSINKLTSAITYKDIAVLTYSKLPFEEALNKDYAEQSAKLLSGILDEDILNLIRYHRTPFQSVAASGKLTQELLQLLRIFQVCIRYDYYVNLRCPDDHTMARRFLKQECLDGILSEPELDLLIQLASI